MVQKEREDIDLRVYFADTLSDSHPFLHSPLLGLVDNFTSPESLLNVTDMENLRALEKAGTIRGGKLLLDYAYALEYLLNSSTSPYIAIFEDDVIFADGWLARTLIALRDIRKKYFGKDFLDLRLFNNESNIGFASKDILGNNVPIIILAAIAVVSALLATFQRTTNIGRKLVTTKLAFVVCFFTIPVLVISFFRAGKSSVLPPWPGVAVQPWGLCSQGVIFPRAQVPLLIAELRKKEDPQPDIVMKYLAQKANLLRFVLNPVQVQHLGETAFRANSKPYY